MFSLNGSARGFSDGRPPVSSILRILLAKDTISNADAPRTPEKSPAPQISPAQSSPSTPEPEARAVTPLGNPTLRPVPAALAAYLPVSEHEPEMPPPAHLEAPPEQQRQPVGPLIGSASSEFVFNRAGAVHSEHEQQSQRYDSVAVGDSPLSELAGTVDAVSCIRHVATGTGDQNDGDDDDHDDAFRSMIPVVDELRRKVGTEARKAKVLGDINDETKKLAAFTHGPAAKLRFDDEQRGHRFIPDDGDNHLLQQAREDMAFALHQIRQQVEMLALIAAERENELQGVIHSLQASAGKGSVSASATTRRKAGGVINVHVVRDYDDPVQPYVKKPLLSRQNSSLMAMQQQQSAKTNRTSSALYSTTNYSSDWTQGVDRSRSINEEVRTAYDST